MVCRVKKAKVGIKVKYREKDGKERGERISGKIKREMTEREKRERKGERGERGIQTYMSTVDSIYAFLYFTKFCIEIEGYIDSSSNIIKTE